MKYLPKKGGWVLITKSPNIEIPVDMFSIYWALPTGKLFLKGELEGWPNQDKMDFLYLAKCHGLNTSNETTSSMVLEQFLGYQSGRKKKIHKALYKLYEEMAEEGLDVEQQVSIRTEWGDVILQPYEYSIQKPERIPDYINAVKDGDATIMYLNESKQLSGKVADQLFYIRSRGVGFVDALQMCINSTTSSVRNIFYIRMHSGLQQHFDRHFDTYFQKKVKFLTSKKVNEDKFLLFTQ